jgi:hypothetical protein
MGTLIQDLRFGLRMLRKSPGFTAVSVLSLALGIGATIAIFSVIYSMVLRTLPVQRPEELVEVDQGGVGDLHSYAEWKLFQDRQDIFSGVLAYNYSYNDFGGQFIIADSKGQQDVGVQFPKHRRHLFQNLVHHLADRSQRMIRWYSLLRGNVAEHSFLVVIVAAHSLVSFSSSFSQTSSLRLKLQMNGGFFNKLLIPLGQPDKPCSCLLSLARSGDKLPGQMISSFHLFALMCAAPAECSFWTEQSII